MCKSFFVILILTVLGVVSSGFLSDGVKIFHFMKIDDGSGEYDFEYELDNGEIFRGRTYRMSDQLSLTHVMFGANDTLYWVYFTCDEYDNEKSLSKVVRLIERSDDKIIYRDDFIKFELIISKGTLLIAPYQTQWDLERICFMLIKNEQQTLFKYLIKATNNSRRYNGTTFYEADDPHVQHIHLDDYPQRDDVYQVKFTHDELHSPDTFCKGISETISFSGILGARPVSDINPNLLKSLAG